MATVLRRFWKNTRTTRWVVIAGVALIASIALVMMFLLAQATNNREIYERNYQRLFVANIVAAAVLLVVLCWLSWRMWLRLRRGKFGSRLLLKLALVFTLVASVPG
ncbi:MAG: PAS domain-containing sensor histidine kinase, partial [Brachymonas sp.]|nr:PAS domain-containing sensor histidine kinase [Brachymonas sp.]